MTIKITAYQRLPVKNNPKLALDNSAKVEPQRDKNKFSADLQHQRYSQFAH